MRLVASYEEGSVWLFLPEQTLRLPQVISASGARFSDGQTTFWNKGVQARLEYQGQVFEDCLVDSYESVWEDTKLRGVDFRATGNEPAWVLEMGSEIHLFLDYGSRSLVFPAVEPHTGSQPNSSVFETRADGHQLHLELSAEPCLDSMSDQVFATRVSLVLDGRSYSGCGRPLH